VLPDKKLGASISFEKENYQPGEEVTFKVEANDRGVPFEKDEKVFASVTVTDISSFYRVPYWELGPTLPSMVYLEREVEQLNDDKGEFTYWQDYVDSNFS